MSSKNSKEFDPMAATPVDAEQALATYERCEVGTFVDDGSFGGNSTAFMKLNHETGALTVGKEHHVVLEPGTTTKAVMLYIDKLKYIEKSPVDFMNPRKWDSEEAAIADGRVTQWPPYGEDGPKPDADPYRDIMLMVQAPDGMETNPGFQVSIGGDDYAVGIFSMGRTNYFENAKNDAGILQTMRWYGNKGVKTYQVVWKIRAEKKVYKNGKGIYFLKFLPGPELLPAESEVAKAIEQKFTTPF